MSGGWVSVIVVSHATRDLTLSAVQSSLVCSQVREAIVIDNASPDGTAQTLEALGDERLRILVSESNVGFGRAANRASSMAEGSALLFLNSDAKLNASAVSRLLAELERWDGRAIVGPRLLSHDGGIQRSAGVLPAPSDLMARALGLHMIGRLLVGIPAIGALVGRARIAREYESAATVTETINTTMVSGACFAIGTTSFRALGGFDERFFMYFEDADLCRRATVAGMPIRYVPSAVVSHMGGASSSEDYHFGPLHARSMRRYLAKWYGPFGSALALLLLWLRAVGFSIAVRPGARRAWAAFWAALRDEDPRG